MSRTGAGGACVKPSDRRAVGRWDDTALAARYLQQVSRLPLIADPASPPCRRVAHQLAAVLRIVIDEPSLGAACTRSLFGTDRQAADIRVRIGAEMHRRVTVAMGLGAWPEVVTTLETMFWGVLVQARAQSLDFASAAARLETMVSLIVPE